ncbi:transporter substrate-binding domain-containing protein [Pseudomonas fluorescens]|uniref:transporter substrate-binding domain-containing protein n=1 Tax=Pseudomonas fluorescens TaxID=294 RepID=UPI001CD21F72|nr:transporter substrate-binding domain-containing protein [Pseudomonas fluorescens]
MKPADAFCLKNHHGRVWGRCATQRGQAPSPQLITRLGIFVDFPAWATPLRTSSTGPLDDLRLADGVRLDAILTQQSTLEAAVKKNYPLKAVDGSVVFYEPLAIAIDKGDPELKASLGEVIGAMHKDGTLTKLSNKWYGVDYSTVK